MAAPTPAADGSAEFKPSAASSVLPAGAKPLDDLLTGADTGNKTVVYQVEKHEDLYQEQYYAAETSAEIKLPEKKTLPKGLLPSEESMDQIQNYIRVHANEANPPTDAFRPQASLIKKPEREETDEVVIEPVPAKPKFRFSLPKIKINPAWFAPLKKLLAKLPLERYLSLVYKFIRRDEFQNVILLFGIVSVVSMFVLLALKLMQL